MTQNDPIARMLDKMTPTQFGMITVTLIVALILVMSWDQLINPSVSEKQMIENLTLIRMKSPDHYMVQHVTSTGTVQTWELGLANKPVEVKVDLSPHQKPFAEILRYNNGDRRFVIHIRSPQEIQ